jgi:hypothetical protein
MVMSTVFQQAVRPLFDYAANAAPAVEILRSLPVEAQRDGLEKTGRIRLRITANASLEGRCIFP